MTMIARLLAAAALAGTAAAPAAAQYPYPYPQQTYPPYGYPNTGQAVVGSIVDQLLGNRYNVTDRGAISRCANAAMVQAQQQYRGYSPYGSPYGGYGQGIVAPNFRVTAITDVERRSNGLRVRGMIDSGGGSYGGYGSGYGTGYGQVYTGGDLTFRCTVDYRGYVSDVRIRPNTRRY